MKLDDKALHLALIAASLLFGIACDESAPPADANPSADGGPADAGASPDASPDADPGDSGTPDAGPAEPGLFAIEDLSYLGAFRLSSAQFGSSSVNSAIGTLGYNPTRDSLFIAGHARENAIAEFAIPDVLGTGSVVAELPIVEAPLQSFHAVLDQSANGNPDGMDRVTGLYWADGHLIVQANRWYDGAGGAVDTTLLVRDGQLDGTLIGYFELDGRARSAGFISPVPAEWQARLGGPALAGWASNYSIISRYSVGPTLFAFDPADITAQAADTAAEGRIEATARIEYPYSGGVYMAPDALQRHCTIEDDVTSCVDGAASSPIWNYLSRAMYGFIVPGTRTYAVFGANGGLSTGIGYKIRQDNNNLCGGYCSYGAADRTNYFWLFDLDEVLAAETPSMPQPYAYGPWEVPFDNGGRHRIIGGTWDAESGTLYLSLGGAGRVGEYDRPPVIVAYRVDR